MTIVVKKLIIFVIKHKQILLTRCHTRSQEVEDKSCPSNYYTILLLIITS